REVQQGLAAVVAGRSARRIGRLRRERLRSVAHALLADLHEHLLAVVRPLLDDTVLKPADPDVVLIVDETTVDPPRHGPRAAVRRERAVAPAVHDVAGGVVLDCGRRRHRQWAEGVTRRLVRTIEGDEVASRIKAARSDAARDPLTGDPALVLARRQGLGP